MYAHVCMCIYMYVHACMYTEYIAPSDVNSPSYYVTRYVWIGVVVKAVIVRVSQSVLVAKSGSGFVVVEIKLA